MRALSSLAALAAVSVALAVAPATAQAQTQQRIGQAQVYRSINVAEMSTLLNGLGFASVRKGADKRFDVETTEGFKFSVELAVCDVEGQPAGCLGVNLYATWSMEAGDEAKLRGAIDKFNSDYRIGKALLLEDSVFAERYVITDGGVTLEHISDEIAEFQSAMSAFSDVMAEALGN